MLSDVGEVTFIKQKTLLKLGSVVSEFCFIWDFIG